jgi:hypothetical protein
MQPRDGMMYGGMDEMGVGAPSKELITRIL